MSRPLEGLLVVALEQAVAAPYCSCRLADAGARVIKVERPEGDFARGYDTAVNGLASYFVWLNRGKESLTADIKHPDDAALLHRILARADVFIQNLLPGAAARAGLGSEVLRKAHPRLVTVDISGYGEDGPYAEMKAYDMLIQAETGLASITGLPAGPGRVGVSVCDVAAGMYAHQAVLEALIKRGRTGTGSGIAVSLFDGLADWMTVPLLHHDYAGKAPTRIGLEHPSISPYRTYESADGVPVLISIQNEREWARLCAAVIGDADLATRPGFASNVARVANRGEVNRIVGAAFARHDVKTLCDMLLAAGIAFGRVNGVAELSRHPQLRRVTIGSENGPIDMPAPPPRIAGEVATPGPIPRLGEHTAAIRREFAA
jgi:crotonobetainyl-CoA:carnitine CoA-transferase CaiB-like acyl-CoA transferase